jgi:hypothetical protein
MNVDINQLIKNVSEVKLKGGIFATASWVVIVVSICLFAVAALAGNVWISCATIGLIFILAFVILWKLISFANKNPQAAILEGAQFLVHEQIQLAAKGVPTIVPNVNSYVEAEPVLKDAKLEETANTPEDIITENDENNG